MYLKLRSLFLFVFFAAFMATNAQTGSNPIFRDEFTADPAPIVYNDTLWVIVGHDEAYGDEMFLITEWLCYSTTDMKNWTAHGSIMRPEHFKWGGSTVQDAWAAQVVEKNGKFYLYTTCTWNGRTVGVAVADHPTGPFVDAKGSPLVSGTPGPVKSSWDNIDPTVLIDDDGSAYLAWGNPNCYFVKLKDNMIEFDGEISIITPPNYAEGPWLSKRKGMYYLTYPAFVDPVGSEQLCYATATNIRGPWKYQGLLSGAASKSYTIHPGIVNYKGNDYLFYHFADYSIKGYSGTLGRRSVCVEYLCYNEDGTMKRVEQTLAGVTVPPPCPSEQYPNITFVSPQNTDSYVEPATIPLKVDVTDGDGTVSMVEFYNGETLLSSYDSAPYEFNWENIDAGKYVIKVVATDNEGNKGEKAITVSVNVPQGPYGGTPHEIPGKIELEAYDVGGNGFAYSDSDVGTNVESAPDFRTNEDVDIEECEDVGGGYNVGWTAAGEWLEYTVNVAVTGTYTLEIRAACNGDDRTISLESDGEPLLSDIAIPNTGDWQAWENIEIPDVKMEAGEQVLRLTIGNVDFVNLNYISFDLEVSGPKVTITSPDEGNEFNVSQTLTITANVEKTSADISEVSFYANDKLISSDNTAPYSAEWKDMEVGTYIIKAEATDADGISSSDNVSVIISEAPSVLYLKAGWNLIGYPNIEKSPVEEAFKKIIDNVEFVKDNEGFYESNGIPSLNSLTELEWGRGYFVKVGSDCIFEW